MLAAAAAGLAMTSSAAMAGWSKATTRHFVIYSDQSPAELQAYATRLEKFDQAVRFARGVGDPEPIRANKLQLFAVRNLPEIASIYGGSGVGGFYVHQAGSNVAFVPLDTDPDTRLDLTADNVFFHEYAHHLMYENMVTVMPMWLSEGFAEFFSTAKFEADGSVGLGAPAAHRAEILLTKLYAPLPTDIMVGGSWKQLRNYYGVELYGRGWLLVHYLTFNAARKGQLDTYVAGLRAGKPAMTAARDAFGDLKRLHSELDQYVRQTRFPYVTVPASKLTVAAPVIEPLSAGESAMMGVSMMSRSGVSLERTGGVATAARTIAARYPGDVAVRVALAEAELDDERYDAAIAAADQALALQPNSIPALLVKGRTIVERHVTGKQAADWPAARALFLKANRADPEDPRPLIHYHRTFEEAGQTPTKDASEGLAYALELSPADRRLRWAMVRDYVRQGKAKEAADTLAPLAYAPHGGKDVERLNAILDALEGNNLGSATQLIAEDRKREDEELAKARRKAGKPVAMVR
ncbi:DUF1570 domain-containing protein [Sphingomonas swuensis]|uniref:DUF1570 domain-containing protein n=2 Tax=Sphingomonas swuensis TaxID=977800 RepID=A0ABP7T9D5_9SPHN